MPDRFVWCDRKSLNRILLNVVSNAYKFTPSGGTVCVTLLETGSPEEGYGTYELRVQDSGIGMSEEFQKTVFVFARLGDKKLFFANEIIAPYLVEISSDQNGWLFVVMLQNE